MQPMSFQNSRGQWIQKGVQKVLEERNLWPIGGLNLECPKPKCFNCELCIRGHKCDSCKTPKNHSAPCSKSRKCDSYGYQEQEVICQCVSKKYCVTCELKKGKCGDCEVLPPKCTTQSKF